jgi:tRNA (guanine9-N1)-methyltransferase
MANLEVPPSPEAASFAKGSKIETSAAVPLDSIQTTNPDGTPISKRQLKKLRKKQDWESQREQRKEKRKQKKHEARERRYAMKAAEKPNASSEKVQAKLSGTKQQLVPLTFIIDTSFDNLMNDNEVKSLSLQISRSYNSVRKSSLRPKLAIANFGGKLKERFDGRMSGLYKNWKTVWFSEDGVKEVGARAAEWMETVPEGAGSLMPTADGIATTSGEDESQLSDASLVYLTADSTNLLTCLSPNTTYIIGGLVDKNRYKGHCHKLATDAGITTARLPISEYVKLSARKVLTVNHVVDIMVQWLETGDWEKAFLEVIPERTGVSKKGNECHASESSAEEADEAEAEASVSS